MQSLPAVAVFLTKQVLSAAAYAISINALLTVTLASCSVYSAFGISLVDTEEQDVVCLVCRSEFTPRQRIFQ